MSQPAHSHIGASSMYRWSECPGSVRLSRGIESVSSKYAEEGTEAHELAADILLGKPTGPVLDEMLEAVQIYVESIAFLRKTIKHGGQMLVEHRFDLSKIHPGLFGTADCVVYDPTQRRLHVFDYKHGAGIAVEVEENSQLLYYGLGALLALNVPCREVVLTIVQPRCPHPAGPVRSWAVPSVRLIDFAADLQEFARATEAEDAPLKAGDHCRFCPAAAICPELHNQALVAAKEEFGVSSTYDPAKLAKTLQLLDIVEAWAKRVREFAYREAIHGRIPPGWKLVDKRATRKWRSEAEAIDSLIGWGVPREELFTQDLKSPAQVEKLLNADGKKRLSTLVAAVSSGQTLVPDQDPRAAVHSDVSAVFEKIASG
jgi:hypothetical protein